MSSPQLKLHKISGYICFLAVMVTVLSIPAVSDSVTSELAPIGSSASSAPLISPQAYAASLGASNYRGGADTPWMRWFRKHKAEQRGHHRGRLDRQILRYQEPIAQPVIVEQPIPAEVRASAVKVRAPVHVSSAPVVPASNVTVAPTTTPQTNTTAPAPTTVAAAPTTAIPTTAPLTPVAPIQTVKSNAPVSALQMTRDAVSSFSAPALSEAKKLDVSQTIIRMLGALLLVLVCILGTVRLLQRYNIVPTVTKDGTPPSGAVKPSQTIGTSALSQTLLAGFNRAKAQRTAEASPSPAHAAIEAGGFQLLNSLNLPGSTASIHLVQASEKTLVIAATQNGVSVLSEVTSAVPATAPSYSDRAAAAQTHFNQEDEDDLAVTAFADILREKAGLPLLANRTDLLLLDRIDSRFSETQERLNARLKSGAELIASTPENSTHARRRAPKAAPPKEVQF